MERGIGREWKRMEGWRRRKREVPYLFLLAKIELHHSEGPLPGLGLTAANVTSHQLLFEIEIYHLQFGNLRRTMQEMTQVASYTVYINTVNTTTSWHIMGTW